MLPEAELAGFTWGFEEANVESVQLDRAHRRLWGEVRRDGEGG